MVDTSKIKETATQTTTTTVDNEIDFIKEIRKPLFVVFAEFLGYESPIISWAEQICLGKMLPPFQQKIVDIDAISIFKKMQEEYTLKEIKEWWDNFYPVVLVDYDKRLEALEKDDLPF